MVLLLIIVNIILILLFLMVLYKNSNLEYRNILMSLIIIQIILTSINLLLQSL